jgi:hypothetical protein
MFVFSFHSDAGEIAKVTPGYLGSDLMLLVSRIEEKLVEQDKDEVKHF